MSSRVLIADDQPIVRTGLTMLLDAQPDIEVVGAAADAGLKTREATLTINVGFALTTMGAKE